MSILPTSATDTASSREVAMVHAVGGALAVIGTVALGDRRGRELGFPTANLFMHADARVEDGVWAADVYVDDVRHIAAVSLGHRPTYYGDDGVRLLEAHLLDFTGDLYGRSIVVLLRHSLRPQRRFGSSVALIRQMRRDVEGVRRWAQSAEGQPLRARGGAKPRGTRPLAERDPQAVYAARDAQRERRIAAAVQHSLAQGGLTHEHVAALARVPAGFVRWAYPTVDELRRVAGKVEVTHPY